ncbi:APC family permease [Sphingomonas swuensis]|uniref:Arginine/agmatine antiporter n=1 Tax=Sphingomonas swuensis TaxID=977800 RepID=A0ABP7SEU1_9SPHN
MSQAELPKRVGLGGAILISFNGAVGAAIFALPATLAGDVGAWAPWLFPLAGLVVLLIAIPFAKAAASMPGESGPVTYGSAFGRAAGFEVGWIYYVARVSAFAANVHVLVDYLLRWTEVEVSPLGRSGLILGAILLIGWANIVGMTRALRLLGGMTLLKSLPLLALALLALVTTPLPTLGLPPPLGAVEASMLLVFYAFVGFESSVAVSGETRDSSRSLPRALLLTVGGIVLLYLMVQLAFVAVDPAYPKGDKAPLLALGTALLGPLGALMVLLAAVASLAGNLHANMAATPRVSHALALRGDLPAWLAAVHPRFLSPHHSIFLLAALAAILALTGGFVWLAVVSTLARMVVYAVTIAAWLKLGRRSTGDVMLGAVGIALSALVASQAGSTAWVTLAVLALAGALLFAVARRSR